MRNRPIQKRLPFGNLCALAPTKKNLCGLVGDFSPVSLTSGQVTHVLLTRPPLPLVPKNKRTFDLHVLGTPPAFILSQDQTRHPLSMSPPAHADGHVLGV